MIAERKIVRVNSQKIELDLGDNYRAFLHQDVEVLVFPCVKQPEVPVSPTSAWGGMRGSIRSIAADFDDADGGSDWEACQ